MTKLKNKNKLLWCIEQFHGGNFSQKLLVNHIGIKPRQFRQLHNLQTNPSSTQVLMIWLFGIMIGRMVVPHGSLNLCFAETSNLAFI
jgi:hypothetical protein